MHRKFAETHKEGRKLISDLRSALVTKALDHPRHEEGRDLPAIASAMYNGVQILWTPTRGDSTGEIDLLSITTPVSLRNQGKARQALGEFLQATDSLGLRVNVHVHPKEPIYTQRVVEWLSDEGFVIDAPNSGYGVAMHRDAQFPTVKLPAVPNLSEAQIMPDLVPPVKAAELVGA